jgi:glycosyltransferase involved in cell wall biosynthesis
LRIHVIDPSAYTPPYDHALCQALGSKGVDVDLYTSRFVYGPVPEPQGYARHEYFYRLALGAPASRLRLASKLAQHAPDMLRYRRAAKAADVVHFQWLSVQHLDRRLLPRARPLVLTAHDVLPREPRPGQLAAQKRLYERFDAIVVHSEHGRKRLVEELGVPASRVNAIPHGAFAHLVVEPRIKAPLESERLVVLCFGLMRPYKGIEVLLDAWQGQGAGQGPIEDAELWIAGMPKMDIAALQARASQGVRWDPRFITDEELPGYFARADLVVLPYLQADQSGVLFTALAHGKPLLLSDVGGFPELGDAGAARIVPAGDALALGDALRELIADEAAREAMAAAARTAAQGRYSWEAIAEQHLKLYRSLCD